MDDRLAAVLATFESNTKLFCGAMAGVTQSAWLLRSGEANHLAGLATHLVGARHFIVGFVGGESTDPLEVYHGGARGIDNMDGYPSTVEAQAAWDEVSPILVDALGIVEAAFLDEESGLPFPAPGPTRLDTLIFLAQHEAYHLGQMGLLRRVAGLAATEWR